MGTDEELVPGPVITLCRSRQLAALAYIAVGGITEHLLLVAGKVDRLRAPGLLHKRSRGDLLDSWPAGGVDGRNEGALLDARLACLPQRGAQSSAGVLGGHVDRVWSVERAKDGGSIEVLNAANGCFAAQVWVTVIFPGELLPAEARARSRRL